MGAGLSREDYTYEIPEKISSFKDQSKTVGTAERCSYLQPDSGPVTSLYEVCLEHHFQPWNIMMFQDVDGVWSNFLHGLKVAGPEANCMGHRPTPTATEYKWISYEETKKRSINVGKALEKLNIEADDGLEHHYLSLWNIMMFQ